jgi:hypothetical protein
MTTFKRQKRKQNGLVDIISKGTSTGREYFTFNYWGMTTFKEQRQKQNESNAS